MNLINTWHLHPMSRCVREGFVHFLKTGEAAEIDTDDLLDDHILLQREESHLPWSSNMVTTLNVLLP